MSFLQIYLSVKLPQEQENYEILFFILKIFIQIQKMSDDTATDPHVEINPSSDQDLNPHPEPAPRNRAMTKMRQTLAASVSFDSHDDEIRS
jgi:hypothetical protein